MSTDTELERLLRTTYQQSLRTDAWKQVARAAARYFADRQQTPDPQEGHTNASTDEQ